MGGDNGSGAQAESPDGKLVASVAQLVEQLTLNQLVLGSSPSRGTIFFLWAVFDVPLPFGKFAM